MIDFLDLDGKNVIVVGISGAIGSAIALNAIKFGVKIYGFDIVAPKLSISLEKFYKGDVASELDVMNFCKLITELNIKVDAVVLAMGVTGEIVDSENIDIINFQNCLNSSVIGATLFIKHFSILFKKNKIGNFILLSSIAGIRGAALMSAYTSAKHAINGLMKAFARELGPWGIRLNSISPGLINSTMARKIQFALNVRNDPKAKCVDEKTSLEAASSIPLRRLGTPDDIANLAIFLLSSSSSYIHGSVINIDGGLSVKY
jgi:NAD(P)-dependent dehydrogenase (short-subunit alcohol dehydrogenase family)